MEIFNNTTNVVKDDLQKTIRSGSKVSIAAACFSIYAFQELKEQLESCEELRFLFTSPTFVAEKTPKERREFYIPRLQREKSLYGTEFEVRLRNELKQKAVARECAQWMRRKAKFRSNTTRDSMNNFMLVSDGDETYAYSPMNSFTTVDLGCERGNNMTNIVVRVESPESTQFLQTFNQVWNDKEKLKDVTGEVIDMISTVYQENPPEIIYYMTLYNIFSEFLEDISEDVLPNEATGFKDSVIWNKLFNFQKDAALGIINKLEQYNGCILADSVGLGKTFTALAVIKYYEGRNKNVLVLCPKKLSENWMTYRGNLINNPLAKDRFRYDVLYHTDLSRNSGNTAVGLPIDRINWGNYDLVVIDESHNFRNGNGTDSQGGEKENRYMRLMNRVIKPGVKTKVLMLSATPVNNRFYDLRNQLALAYGGDPEEINGKLKTKSDIDTIFRQAQAVYNTWCKLPEAQRTTDHLLASLDYDFFEVLDSVTIARSRKHIQTYYDVTDIGSFPKRLKPVSLRPKLTNRKAAINYKEVIELLTALHLTIYTPTVYIQPSKLHKYLDEKETEKFRMGREIGIQRLMSINLLKRMESSVHSFLLTVKRICDYLYDTSQTIEAFRNGGSGNLDEMTDLSGEAADFDDDDQNTDFFGVGKKVRIDLRDMDYLSWKRDIDEDIGTLSLLIGMVEDITPQYDYKLSELLRVIREKVEKPINPGNKKVLIFTAFSDTAEYLYEHVSGMAKTQLGLNTALITGAVDGKTTIPGFKAEMNHVLTCFSPKSKDRDVLYPKDTEDIDILIATDCISEGQNLQDCDYCINYDIHWNPVRIIQRFGRIDRIGSRSEYVDHARYYKAYIDYAEGRYGRAKQAFTALLRSDAYRDVVPYYLMQIEFREGNYRYVVENGETLARRAVPERRAELERVVAESWFRLEDFNRTLEHLAAFRKAGGEMDRDASYLEGFSLYRTARYAEAAEWLRKACGAEDALTQNASYHLADCYLRAGDKESAMQAFAMASDESLDATVAEDALFFLVLSTDTITLGPITLSAERNYAENVLMMVCAAMTCWFALRQLNIHSNTSPVVDDTLRYRQTAEDLLVYAKRHQLTAREQEVLDYILRDQDNQNIASAMSLSPSTVKVHVHNILQKTGHTNRQELIQDFWKTV